jgi:hypothetical protein
MNVTIVLSEQTAAALEEQARAAHMPAERYASKIVESALRNERSHSTHEQPPGQPLKPRKPAYGLLAKYGPGPTREEIDENRREMFSGFGEIAP